MTVNASSKHPLQGFPTQPTGPIPNNVAPPAQTTASITPEASPPNLSSNESSQSSLSKTITPKGESLTSIDLHGPEENNQAQSDSPTYHGDPYRGARLQARFFERKGLEISSEENGKPRSSNPENRGESLDLPMAMLIQTEQASSLDEYQMALQTALQRLPSLTPNATPLSQSEVFKLNQTLSRIGLSTDGKTLFNMTLRMAGPKGLNEAAAAPCNKSETEMLMDLVSTRQACLKVPAGEPNPFAINKMGAQLAAPGSGMIGMASMAALGMMEGTNKKQLVETLVRDGLRVIQENQALMAHLLPAAAEADRELEAAIVQVAQVRTEATTEQQTYNNLSDASESLQPGRPIPSPSVINPQLASLNLQVGQSNGQTTFFQGGRRIDERAFRQILNRGLLEQFHRLVNVKEKLQASEQNLINKREISAELSHKINKTKDVLTQTLDQIGQLAKDNPNLSSELKRQISEATTAVKKMIAQADSQLKRSESLRQQATLALLALQLALNQLDQDLGKAKLELKQLEIQPSQNVVNQTGDQTLSELEQQPNGARLHQLAKDWLKLSEDSLGDRLSLQRNKQNEQAQQREYFDRASQALRESLTYHQKQLEKLDQAGQQKLTQALREHIQITQQLSSDQ